MKKFILMSVLFFSFSAVADVTYTVSDVGFNSCACAGPAVSPAFQISSGNCIFTITGKIRDSGSETVLTGIIATATTKVFDLEKNCTWNHSTIQLVYHGLGMTPEVVSIQPETH